MTVDDDVILDNKGNILTKREEEVARKAFKEWGDTDSDNELSFEEYLKKEWFNNGSDSDIDISTIPVLESKRYTECNCDSINTDILESQKKKVPQQPQLVPKNRLHLSYMEQISMDNDALISSSSNNHNSKILDSSCIIYDVTRLSNYVDNKEDFYEAFGNSEDAKNLINEFQQIINSLNERKSEEKPTEHLKSFTGLYSLLDYQKISDMNKSEMIKFTVAVNSLSHTLQEHKYDENILKIIGDSNNSKLSPIELNNGNTIDDPNKYQEQRTDEKNGFKVREGLSGGEILNLILYNTTGRTLHIQITDLHPFSPEPSLLDGELFKDKYLIYSTSTGLFDVTVTDQMAQPETKIHRVKATLIRKPYKIFYRFEFQPGGISIPILEIKEIVMPLIEQKTVEFINDTGKKLCFRVKTNNRSIKGENDIIKGPISLTKKNIPVVLKLRSSLFLFPLRVTAIVTNKKCNSKEATKLMTSPNFSVKTRIKLFVWDGSKTAIIKYGLFAEQWT